ncbi:MAG: exodeoxyribonuclease V subunit gamma [Spirochaetia bacterium]|nr:exodeoxyribonuclease V subunit gamma [Spirochaetia bacterium]
MSQRSSFYFCNNLQALAARLDEHLREGWQKRDPLVPVNILVPNRNVARWLQMFLAEAQGPTGVCANMRFLYLEEGLKHYLAKLDPKKRSVRIVSRDETELFLLEALLSGQLKGHLGNYISDATPRKTHQLASRLASLFQEYEYHRSDWIQNWIAGKFGKGLAAEQAKIYAQIRQNIRSRDATASSLGEYASAVFADLKPEPGVQEEIFVFAVSQISDLHQGILFSMSALLPVRYFMVDTAMSGGDDEWRLTSKPTFKTDTGFPRSWLDPHRRTLLTMHSARRPEHDWFVRRVTPEGPELLKALQRAVLKQPARKIPAQLEMNPSVRIFACPGIFREAETVYHSIMAEMERDPDLTLTDIAVLVPDMTKYRPVLESIFERDLDADDRVRIPFSITDFSSNQTSVYARGIESLLNLVEGDFSRSEMFELFMNPCFQERKGVTRQDVAGWLQLAESLGIHRGLNGRHSFHSGLKRLRMGFIVQNQLDRQGDAIAMADPFVDERAVGILSVIVSDLEEKLESICAAPPERLHLLLNDLFDSFLAIPEGMSYEMRVREKLAALFAMLRKFEPKNIRFEVLREIILEAVQGLSASRGEYLANGVTLSALQPMRPIPFKLLYIMGMEEGRFPGRADESEMDLRIARPIPSDVSLPEANRLLLLEAIMSATEKLIVTYNCRDIRRDARFEISTAISEIVAFAEDYAGQIPVHFLPLTASSGEPEGNIVHVSPAEQAMAMFHAGVSSEALAVEIERRREISTIAGLQSPANRRIPRITLDQLSRYLTYPLDTVMRQIGSLYSDEAEDLSLKDREPVFAEGSIFYRLCGDILTNFFGLGNRKIENLEGLAYEMYRQQASTLKLPLPAFGEADLFPILIRWRKAARDWTPLLVGQPFSASTISVTLYPDGFPDGVELTARMNLLRELGGSSECLIPIHRIKEPAFLSPFLFHQVRRCIDEGSKLVAYQVAYGKGSAFKDCTMRDVGDPQRFLTEIAGDFLSANSQFIPYDLVKQVKSLDASAAEYQMLLQSELDEPSPQNYWRDELVNLVTPELDETALGKARQRFKTFLEMFQK